MVYSNISKAIYLNNKFWTEVDLTSVNGNVRCWGVTPSMLSFNLNRHWDSQEKDAVAFEAAQVIKHLDNVKLVIVPESEFFRAIEDGGKYGGKWPDNYGAGAGSFGGGNGNWPPTAESIDDHLFWQGVYVDPTLEFSTSDDMGFAERFDITCYDYRWCINKTLFRTPPLAKHIWRSGEENGKQYGWQTFGMTSEITGEKTEEKDTRIREFPEANENTKVHGYEFTYNESIPETDCDSLGNSWVKIVEHIIRTAMYNYRDIDNFGDFGNLDNRVDPGSVWWHIPDYANEGFEHPFSVEINFAGLRLNANEKNDPLFLTIPDRNNAGVGVGNCAPLASEIDVPYAELGVERKSREFIPDPISISNTKVLNAIQNVLDETGTFEMYMDQFNVLRFFRQPAPEEIDLTTVEYPKNIVDKTDDKNSRLYIARYADSRKNADGSEINISPADLRFYGVRGIKSLKPRAIPEANRVIGMLKGRAPLAHDVLNDRASGDFNPDLKFKGYAFFCSAPKKEEKDAIAAIKGQVKYSRHYTNKIYAVAGNIATPHITPFLYVTLDKDGNVEKEHIFNEPYGDGNGRLLEANVGSGPNAPIETIVFNARTGKKEVYRYWLGYTVAQANLSIVDTKPNDPNANGDALAGGGHTVALNGPAYTAICLNTLIEDSDEYVITTKSQVIAITHSWDVEIEAFSRHRKQYATNEDHEDSGEGVCIYGMGVAPTSEVFSIDSSYNTGSSGNNDWTDFEQDENNPDLAFPGLGEFRRAVIDAPLVMKSVEELTPQYDDVDDIKWVERWEIAKTALKAFVKNMALRLRQITTEGNLPYLYDPDLKLEHRVCVWGSRDDLEQSEADNKHWMRLNAMRGRINSINLTTSDELELEFTTEKALPEFSVLNWVQNL